MKSELAVLLVDGDENSAAGLREALEKSQSPAIRAQWAGTLASALELLSSAAFDVVVLDLELPDSAGFETFSRLKQQQPEATLVVLTAADNEELALRTLRAGAQEHLNRSEARAPGFGRRLRYAVERHRSRIPRAARVLTFIGSKGGVGTTTVALNMAAAMLATGKSVIAIEMHPDYGSFATQLILTPTRTIRRLSESASINAQQVQEYLFKLPSGLQVLFGPQNMSDFSHQIDAERAVTILKAAASLAEVVILDLPSGPSAANAALVHASNFTVLVMERERAAFESLLVHLPLVESWSAAQRTVGALVVNRLSFVQSVPLEEILRRLECGFLGSVPPAAELLSIRGTGAPLVLAQPDVAFSQSIKEVAERLSVDPVRYFEV
jgi:MinD-like ATPase involved in chromosome partitioning or flagellar assembly